MSQSESDQIDKLEQYRSSAGVESRTADISSDDHPLKKAFGGGDEQKSFKFDAEIIAERISNWYDSDGATIREFLSNAETACIRRAKMELQNSGESVPNEVAKTLEKAKEQCGYEPLIEVTYNRKSDDSRLIIEDNGCGINLEEYQVLRNIGYSATHSEGGVGDGFGMGIMSFAQLTGTHGMMKFSTRSFPSVDREEVAYSVAMYVTNLEFLDKEPDGYGTRFEFPDFSNDAKSVNIPSKVEEFTEGMLVPVLYRDFDESGKETGRSDDFLPRKIEDRYPDDSMVITYENEYFKAVMSPDRKENERGTITYNISVPIRRNTDAFGTRNRFDAKWAWDFRGKREDGPIVSCPSDPSLEGLVPKEDTKYEKTLDDLKEKCVPMSEVPDDAIVMPQPASSRDSFKSGHDDFWRHVSENLTNEWAKIAKKRFEQVDSWQDVKDMERDEKEALFRAYDHFGPKYSNSEPDTIQEELKDSLGITIDKDLASKIHESQSSVLIVKSGSSRPHTKGATRSRAIWRVIDEAPDGVYMGKTINKKKANIAWGLGETHVVRLEKNDTYDELESLWGWNKLKNLPSRNIEEKIPELDQEVIDEYASNNTSSSSTSSSSSSTGGDGKDPKTYRGKVRVGSNSRKYYTEHKIDNLVETLEDGEPFRAGRYKANYLVIYDEDTSANKIGREANTDDKHAGMRAPKYVYNYLKDKKNVYESVEELYDDKGGVDITLSDGKTVDVMSLPETDILICASDKVQEYFEGRVDDLLELLGYNPDEYSRKTLIGKNGLDDLWDVDLDATVIFVDRGVAGRYKDYDNCNEKLTDLKIKDKFDEETRNSQKFETTFGYRYGDPSESEKETLINVFKAATTEGESIN